MSKSDLRKKAEIAPNTMTKLRRDEEVSLTILSKICKTLNADFGDIVEYVPDAEIWDLYDKNRELLGREHVRGEQLPIDGYHLVAHVVQEKEMQKVFYVWVLMLQLTTQGTAWLLFAKCAEEKQTPKYFIIKRFINENVFKLQVTQEMEKVLGDDDIKEVKKK